jgi:hypothetical protein
MKFNCGPTKKQKLEKKAEKMRRGVFEFLWFPERLDNNECRWLEFCIVEYRKCHVYDGYYGPRIWDVNRRVIYKGDPEYKELAKIVSGN